MKKGKSKVEKNEKKSLGEVHGTVEVNHTNRPWKKIFAFFGPAYLVSVGYMDPGNWATDLKGGSEFGYTLLWILLVSNLTALLLQSLSARMGIAGGVDLAQASRQLFPGPVNWALYLLAEIAIAACDLAEVIGMAIGLHLLFGIPKMMGVLITFADTFLLLYLINKGMRKMEAFIISLVTIIGLAFIGELMISEPNIKDIMTGFAPSSLSESQLYVAISIIGATVMPHNLYLHSALVQTRKIDRSSKGIKEAIRLNTIDSALALNMAFFVNAAILILAATAFYQKGIQVEDIEDAHQLLKGIFGPVAPALFAIALIAAGQSSTVTGTLAGQIIMEGYLNLRLRPWFRRILTRSLAIVPAVLTILLAGENHLMDLLVFSQVILSLQLGFAIIPMLHFVQRNDLMQGFAAPRWMTISGWVAASAIIFLNGKLVASTFMEWIEQSPWYINVLLGIVPISAALLLLYIIINPWWAKKVRKDVKFHTETPAQAIVEEISYRNIGIALDFGSMDVKAISHALSLRNSDSKYFLFHVVESPAASLLKENLYNAEVEEDRQRLLSYAQEFDKRGIAIETILGFGSPVQELANLSRKHQLNLLVMGSHGHRGINDMVHGATIDSLRHQLEIPILVVS